MLFLCDLHSRAIKTVLARDDLPSFQLGGEQDISSAFNSPEGSTDLVATLAGLEVDLHEQKLLVTVADD